jgi:hypothetical protein
MLAQGEVGWTHKYVPERGFLFILLNSLEYNVNADKNCKHLAEKRIYPGLVFHTVVFWCLNMEKLFLVVAVVAGLGSASALPTHGSLPSMVNPNRNGVANSLEDFSAT